MERYSHRIERMKKQPMKDEINFWRNDGSPPPPSVPLRSIDLGLGQQREGFYPQLSNELLSWPDMRGHLEDDETEQDYMEDPRLMMDHRDMRFLRRGSVVEDDDYDYPGVKKPLDPYPRFFNNFEDDFDDTDIA